VSATGHAASRAERIAALLRERLRPLRVEVRDDSAAHAGHVGGGGKGHFHVLVVSEVFAGQTLVQRHRLVHDVLAPLLESDIHALALSARSPDEMS
jgi:BolA protein